MEITIVLPRILHIIHGSVDILRR